MRRGYGDRLSQTMHNMLATATFFGNDVDARMVSLATMNLMLRGLPDVHIVRRNVLTMPLDGFSVVLANPPFSGKIDKDRIVDDVKVGTTTATEILCCSARPARIRSCAAS
jgi:type I restriction enzyme M protein